MTDNRFDLDKFGILAALGAEPQRNSFLDCTPPMPKPAASPMARAIADLLMDAPKSTRSVSPFPYALGLNGVFGNLMPTTAQDLSNTFANLVASPSTSRVPSSAPTKLFGSFTDLVAPVPPSFPAYTPKPKPVAPETKRKAFFSFHFDDIMRVNNVRNAWKITHSDSSVNRSFYDSSLWENRKLVGPEGIKQLIRSGVLCTSAVCVLAGSMTWDRRWVKYEIARAVIDGRGLLTVHLNRINHHQTKEPHARGLNPLAHMGLAKLQPNKRLPPQYYLYEMKLVPDRYDGRTEQWVRYCDYTAPVKKPAWLADPAIDHVMPLSVNAAEYDYVMDCGHRNIRSWIDLAAKQTGR